MALYVERVDDCFGPMSAGDGGCRLGENFRRAVSFCTHHKPQPSCAAVAVPRAYPSEHYYGNRSCCRRANPSFFPDSASPARDGDRVVATIFD